jgi:FixJ family two-component response regulator
MTKGALVGIIDDDESVREALESLLNSMGWSARTFSSAEEFLRNGPCEETACLILDVRMPGMSGLDLQRQLAIADHRIPIVFISAHDDDGARVQALQAGAVDFLYKPFSEEVLLAAVNAALAR